MFLFLFLFGLALGAVSPSDDPQAKLQRGRCDKFFKGRCYKYVATPLTWADAERHCVSQGANLVSIHSREDHYFVRRLIKTFDHAERPTWIGLSDTQREGSWMWSDGCPVDFVFWHAGEPNNNWINEDCVHTNFGRDLKWNDWPCSKRLPSVCASPRRCR